MRTIAIAASVATLLAWGPAGAATDAEKRAVLGTYADIALAAYGDALQTARTLHDAIDALVEKPSAGTLAAARTAWKAARVPYQQTEAYRFGNAIVDDWEGRVNAWPLDEGLIDYVSAASYGTESDENPYYTANLIANPALRLSGREIDAKTISTDLIRELNELDEIEANVTTGYHAIEFLLWGQDVNGTGPGAGDRPYTDFDAAACTGGHCERRAQYLKVAADLLVSDLEEMVANWEKGGAARKGLIEGDPDAGIATILVGMGSLSYGELAGERMKLGLMLHDPEEEHDCFSDNTHWSHFYDAKGIRNVYLGSYQRVDGGTVTGPSLSGLVAAADPAVDAALREKLDATMARMQHLVDTAEGGKAYDQMLAEGDDAGNKVVQDAVDALLAQTREIERAVAAMGLTGQAFEGSDSLDNPSAVVK